jgi:AcrR family transcriptional regulator
MEAMLDLSFESGYEAVSLEQVVAAAGGERADFDRAFASKQDCAIAVLKDLTNDNLRAAREAYEGEARWPDSLRAAAYAEARWIVANPKKVRFGFVEMLWAGELAQAVREAAIREYIGMVDGGRAVAADPDSIPASTAEAAIGSITEMLMKKLQQGQPPDPWLFVPELMYLAVRPYLGEELAQRELAIPPPSPRRK